MDATEAPADMEELLGGLHEWQDVQGVLRTTFGALYDVVNAQSHTVREVEGRLAAVQKDVGAMDVRAACAAASDARAAVQVVSRRLEEEVQCAADTKRLAGEETQALRSSVTELRTNLEKQRAEVQQWRTSLEAGLARLTTECAAATQAVHTECREALQRHAEHVERTMEGRLQSLATALEEWRDSSQCETDRLSTTIEGLEEQTDRFSTTIEGLEEQTDRFNTTIEGLEEQVAHLHTPGEASVASKDLELEDRLHSLDVAVSEKVGTQCYKVLEASLHQLQGLLDGARQREEGHLAKLTQLCDSKVSVNEFATLAALAEGKASLADVESTVQRLLRKKFTSMVEEHQSLSASEATSSQPPTDTYRRLQECELRGEEFARKQSRMAAASDELRTELRSFGSTKLDRTEAEAIVAGALADWIRAAHQGADAVQAAFDRRTFHPSSSFGNPREPCAREPQAAGPCPATQGPGSSSIWRTPAVSPLRGECGLSVLGTSMESTGFLGRTSSEEGLHGAPAIPSHMPFSGAFFTGAHAVAMGACARSACGSALARESEAEGARGRGGGDATGTRRGAALGRGAPGAPGAEIGTGAGRGGLRTRSSPVAAGRSGSLQKLASKGRGQRIGAPSR